SGIIVISIPAGASTGATLVISGIRISVPSLGTATTLDARVGLSSNFISANQTTAHVVIGLSDGFTVDPASVNSFTVASGFFFAPLGSFTFRENTPDAFSSAVGTAGHNQSTQIVFKVTGLPDGVSVIFPAVITGINGATLTTLSGSSETVTNQ